MWKVALSRWGDTTGQVAVEKLADFPNTGLLSKVAVLPVSGGPAVSWPRCLLTDSTAGTIVLFDPNTKNTFTWLSDSTMTPASPDDPIWRSIATSAKSGRTPISDTFGVTGITCHDGYVDYPNSHKAQLYRVKFDRESFQALPNTTELVCRIAIRHSHMLPASRHCVDLIVIQHEVAEGPVVYMAAEEGIFRLKLQGRKRFRQFLRQAPGAFTGATCLELGDGEGGYMRLDRYHSGTHLWVGTRGTWGTDVAITGTRWRSGKWQEFWKGGKVLRQYIGLLP